MVLGLAGLSLTRVPLVGACSHGTGVSDTCDQDGWRDGGRLAVEGYTTQRSYVPGEWVIICMSSAQRIHSTVTIERLGVQAKRMWTASLWVKPVGIPVDASENGCGWELEEGGKLTFEIPNEWPSGVYRVTMSVPPGAGRQRSGETFFVVRSSSPGRAARTLLVLSSHTYFAYNNYGLRPRTMGFTTSGSFYGGARHSSFLRPLPLGFISPYDCGRGEETSSQHRYAGWNNWEWPFVQWGEREGIALEYATQEDLERYPDLLTSYRLVLSVGHDEYWSEGMRDIVDRYIRGGGNVAFFSGNVCYRKVRLDIGASRLTLVGELNGESLWSHRDGPNRPENRLTGVSFCYGALNPDPVPYTIYQPDHWMFRGLWPSGGKPKSSPQVGCIGYECDGCDLEWSHSGPVPTHRDGTPDGFEILGYAPGRMPEKWAIKHSRFLFGLDNGFTPWGKDLRQGGAVLGLWKQRGTVVSVGCTEWARHLGDARVAQITRNIVTHLSD